MPHKPTAVIGLALLTACAGAPAPNEMTIDRGEGGMFWETVGSDWSDAELQANAFGALCGPDEAVTDLTITRADDGTAEFSGRCLP